MTDPDLERFMRGLCRRNSVEPVPVAGFVKVADAMLAYGAV